MSGLNLLEAGIAMEGTWLVRGVSLEISPGRLTALVGPNGSGKSTILRLLAGLWRPTEGQAQFNGENLRQLPRRRLARQVTFVPQDARLDFSFTVRDVVAMGRHPHLGRFRRENPQDRKAVGEALERADVVHLSERPANALSGGEKQRVLLARSLATQADVILLDEPTANLDVDHTLEILDLCRALCREKKAVAVALHDLNAVWRFADRVALVHQGRLRATDEPARVLTNETLKEVFRVRTEYAQTPGGETALLFHRWAAENGSDT